MTEFESITFFIDRCLGNKLIVETLRGAGLTVEIHDDHFSKNDRNCTLRLLSECPKCGARFKVPALWVDGWCQRYFTSFGEMKECQQSI
jgi:hypothetical protein